MRHKYLKDVTTLSLNAEKCVGCGICATVCPHGVFDIAGKKAHTAFKDFCIECGACALNCPAKALEVNPGVGCALAIIMEWITGDESCCDCFDTKCC